MEDRWQELARRRKWDSETAEECWQEMHSLYESESRHYHCFNHIADCLDQLGKLEFEDADSVELAIWFHDVIYDTDKPDNEAASAIFSKLWLGMLGESPGCCRKVERLILVTDHKTCTESNDEALLVDIDLSILGSPSAEYRRYSEQIKSEYASVPDDLFRDGRIAVLNSFLNREGIYQTPIYRERLEQMARRNLEGELAKLIGELSNE